MTKTIKRKLILSGITLAIAGFAATASTFAWFTSNSTVSTSSVTGTVASDASIYIKNSTDANWGNTATLNIGDTVFAPVQTSDGASFKTVDNKDADAKSYFQFTLEFTGTVGTGISMTKASFAKATSDVFTLKADAGDSEDVKKGKTLELDVVDAIQMVVTTPTQANTETSTNTTTTTSNTTKTYKYSPDETVNYNALTYYNNMLGTTLTGQNTNSTLSSDVYLKNVNASKAGDIFLGYIPKDNENVLSVTFTIFLDGWDQECFDAICAQTFKASLSFAATDSLPETV